VAKRKLFHNFLKKKLKIQFGGGDIKIIKFFCEILIKVTQCSKKIKNKIKN